MSTQRGVMAALLAVGLLLSLAGCPDDPKLPPKKAPAAGQRQNPPKLDPGINQPAPVRGDPSAHNTQPGQVGLFVTWEAESRTTPVCEWTRNGVVQPCANMEQPTREGNSWVGIWEHEERATAGAVYTLTAQGTGAVKVITCEIAWKSQIHPGISQGSRCGASFTLN